MTFTSQQKCEYYALKTLRFLEMQYGIKAHPKSVVHSQPCKALNEICGDHLLSLRPNVYIPLITGPIRFLAG